MLLGEAAFRAEFDYGGQLHAHGVASATATLLVQALQAKPAATPAGKASRLG
jgi:hypothetical protein